MEKVYGFKRERAICNVFYTKTYFQKNLDSGKSVGEGVALTFLFVVSLNVCIAKATRRK